MMMIVYQGQPAAVAISALLAPMAGAGGRLSPAPSGPVTPILGFRARVVSGNISDIGDCIVRDKISLMMNQDFRGLRRQR